jgi:thiol-disulfide isomerase/thioredoxin
LTTIVAHTQKFSASLVNIGDPAPLLRVHEWIKGTPVQRFEKGHVYVIEFWATWCTPCKAAMPHLSALAHQYKDSVTMIGIDIYEEKTTSIKKIKAFVDSMGKRMDYSVATEDSNFTVPDWIEATGEKFMGIPRTFVVDREGRLAWIGHPCDLEDVLSKIVSNTWDIKGSLVERNLQFRLRKLDDSLTNELKFAPNGDYRSDSWKRDSALLLINEMAKTEPLIKFTPRIAYQIFSILLRTDMKKAYEYGKKVIATTTYEKPAVYIIRGVIEDLSEKINPTPEIYQLGIDAIRLEIDEDLSCYPEIINIYKRYYKMAEWYYRIGNKSRAIETQEKAIEALKSKKNFSTKDLTAYESRLKQYRSM